MQAWLDVLGCPVCLAQLGQRSGGLHCSACSLQFDSSDGILTLLTPHREEELDELSREYREMRLREGWRPMPTEQILALPFGSPEGYNRIYWHVRRQSFAVLKRWLSQREIAPEGRVVADIGAGLGWLAFRLAGLGFRTIALDASVDRDFGLGEARAYAERSAGRMLVVRGDLERLPIQRGSLDTAVFNASLHYAEDLSRAILRAAAALKPKGSLIVLDTPISRTPVPGTRLGGRHIGRRELEEAIRSAGLRPGWVPVRRGPRWWLHQAFTRLRRKPTFSLPMLVASRP